MAADPAQEDVAGRLHQPLAGDDAMGVVLVAALADVGLQDRRSGLLELQEERIAVVTAQQQDDEGQRADAAHADDLHRHVDELIAVDELTVVFLQGLAIVGERLLCHPVQVGLRRRGER